MCTGEGVKLLLQRLTGVGRNTKDVANALTRLNVLEAATDLAATKRSWKISNAISCVQHVFDSDSTHAPRCLQTVDGCNSGAHATRPSASAYTFGGQSKSRW